MMPTTTKASAFAPSWASSLPTCGPTNSLRQAHRLDGACRARLARCGLALLGRALAVRDDAALGLAERLEDVGDERVALQVGAHRHADHHVARAAEVLHHHVAEVHRLDRAANLAELGRLRVGDLDHVAAGELDRVVQPARGEEEHGGEEGHQRDDVEHQRMPHERDVAADAEELHRGSVW
jgi:hypothetical protein